MEGKNRHENCSYDDQVDNTTSVLRNIGPKDPMQMISQQPPKEMQFLEIAPPAEEPLDLSLGLSLGGLYKEIKESPNPNPLSLTATRATAVNNANPPITSAQNYNGILPPSPQPPLPPYNVADDYLLEEIASYMEAQKKRRFEAYRRLILRRRARERAEAKKVAAAAAAAAAFLPVPPLAAAAVAQLPQVPLPRPITLPGAVPSYVENRELCRAVEKMNALGESSGKKILEGASTLATGTSFSSSQQTWTSNQLNLDPKAFAAKAVNGKSAILTENIFSDEQIKRLELLNAGQNNNAHQKNSNDDGLRGMKQLLTVTTMGDGPEAKKVDGLLYKFSKGGHIFIVCLCHGIFLSPDDFVKHANHTDWSNPMKHIAVSSPQLPF